MPFSDYALSYMLGVLANQTPTTMSLHTAYSIAGAFEVAGGLPAYARQPVTLINSGLHQLVPDPLVPVLFDVPAGVTVPWLGLWQGTTFLGMFPIGYPPLVPFFISTVSGGFPSDLISINHGLTDSAAVLLHRDGIQGLPLTSTGSDLLYGVTYYVLGSTPDTFQLAISVVGSPLVYAREGSGWLQFIPNPYASAIQSVLDATSLLVLDASLGT